MAESNLHLSNITSDQPCYIVHKNHTLKVHCISGVNITCVIEFKILISINNQNQGILFPNSSRHLATLLLFHMYLHGDSNPILINVELVYILKTNYFEKCFPINEQRLELLLMFPLHFLLYYFNLLFNINQHFHLISPDDL